MSQWDQFDNLNNGDEEGNPAPDNYQSESSADIYNTPDVTGNTSVDVPTEETPAAEVVVESTPVEEAAESAPAPYNNNPYSYNQYNNNQYNNNQYNNNPYGAQPQNGGQGSPYNNNQYGGNPYNNGRYGGNPYNNNQYGGNPYNSGQYGGNPYNNNQYGNNPYNNNRYNNPYGGQMPYNNNQYSPYAMPPKKNKNGLILGIVIAVIVLFLIAIFALVFRAMELFAEDRNRTRSSRDEYRFDYDDDDGWGVGRKEKEDPDYDDDDDWYDDWHDDYDDYDDDWYDDYDDYYDEDSEYYYLHDDLRWDLSYSVDFEEYDSYDTGIDDGAEVYITYPVIVGDNVPNLDRLNDAIQEEVDFLKDLASDVEEDEELFLFGEGYVTYMDEEKLSVVFHESLYRDFDSDSWTEYYLYSLNIDMKNGVVLDNQNIINVNDDFSVDFRQRSDTQNGEIHYLTMLTDQEITKLFKSSDIIVFYTPMGMEIGLNYEDGWVTVTYEDYEQYLKVF